MPRTSVLLVDDNVLFRESARAFFSREDDIEIVGCAASAAEAIALVERLKPCVVLMDVSMPGMDGIEATRALKRLPNAPVVVVLTLYADPIYRAAAASAGADAFLSKGDLATELLPSLRRVRRGTAGPVAGEGGRS